MVIILERQDIPATGQFNLELQVSTDIQISSEEAQRRVSRFLLDEVSYLMHGETPTLVVADRVYWRVPAVLTFPSYGIIGEVGAFDVDVETGEIIHTEDQIMELERRAEDLAERHTPEANPAG